jgi:methyl-accepting chemotaxis protein
VSTLKLSTRLALLAGTLATVLLAVGGLGLHGIGRSGDALKAVYEERTAPIDQLGRMQTLLLADRLAVASALLAPTPPVIQAQVAQVEANIATAASAWDAYLATTMTAQEEALARQAAEDRGILVQQALLPTLKALRAGNLKEAQRLELERLRPLAASAEQGLRVLIRLRSDGAREAYAAATASAALVRRTALAAMAGGMLFALLFGTHLSRSIGRQLGAEPRDAARLAQRVAAGDLATRIEPARGDGSSLMARLHEMQASLAKVVTAVRQNADSLATASAQIAAGNNDLSERTEQQASALEETAASLEQLSATVRQNADNARQASQLALGASGVAVKGGEVVGQVVHTMKGIHDASRRIADIIGVIDGIAFQTNLLALNAAVEAARAGEQGRGFAVVAAEVRNLAQRTAEAAKEIKGLIGTSVERVSQGSTLVDQAGTTMTEIVAAIKRVADIMGEISAASTEQSGGVAQVGEAVSQMDQATQQNAALVEQSAAAAESLRQQALQLVQTVALFQLGPAEAAPVGAEPACPVVERRGPQRAINVTRPDFRARRGTVPQHAGKQARAVAEAARTGTDDWESF